MMGILRAWAIIAWCAGMWVFAMIGAAKLEAYTAFTLLTFSGLALLAWKPDD